MRISLRATFEKLEHASSVRVHASESEGETLFEISPQGDHDLRADIFAAAVDNKLTLLGLERHGQNLENIFRELTDGEEVTHERCEVAATGY